MNKYIVIDCEMSGIDEKCNLLTAYFGIIQNDKIIDELYLELMPDDGIFTIEPTALLINKIDILFWIKLKYKDAKPILYKFLKKYYTGSKFIPIGQGLNGDIKWITNTIISPGSWYEYVSFLGLDTLYIANFLRDCGKLNLESISLVSLANYFNLDVSNLHNSKFDALLTFEIYKQLKQLACK